MAAESPLEVVRKAPEVRQLQPDHVVGRPKQFLFETISAVWIGLMEARPGIRPFLLQVEHHQQADVLKQTGGETLVGINFGERRQ